MMVVESGGGGVERRCLACYRVGWQRPSLHGGPLLLGCGLLLGNWLSRLDGRLLGLGTGVVVCDLDADLASILAPAGEVLPDVVLATARDDDILEVDPSLANQVSLLVVGEDGDFELIVVGGIVDGEAQFLVPGREGSAIWER